MPAAIGPATSTATAGSTWPWRSQTFVTAPCRPAGQRRRHLPAHGRSSRERDPISGIAGGRLQRRRPTSTWPPRTHTADTVSVSAGQRRRHVQTQVTYAVGVAIQGPSWRVTSTATAAPTSPSPTRRTDGTVSVLLGNGDGTFRPQVDLRTWSGGTPASMVAGTSTATAAPTSPSSTTVTTASVSVLLGNGDGTFEPQRHYAVGIERYSGRWWRDFNGDGRTDLAVADQHRTARVSVLLGNGDGTFQPQRTANQSGQSPHAIATGDFNGDGRARPRHRERRPTHRVGAAGQRRRHLPAARSPTRSGC